MTISRPLPILLASSVALIVFLGGAPRVQAQGSFINFETPHVHPLDLAPGDLLLAVNTADGMLEVFDVSGATPQPAFAVPVGYDPVSVRARTGDEAWVVNLVSDTISIVDLTTRNVRATLQTADEPADVVFAGSPQRAFVSCSQANLVQVFDPTDLNAAPVTILIEGEDPRALAVSPDGSLVYVAIFESGNATTILGGGGEAGGAIAFPPNVVDDPDGPHGGQNPPPNSGAGFSPALNPGLPAAPAVGLIVRRNTDGNWMDDNGGNWTQKVSGSKASDSGRSPGWDLMDHDLALINTSSLSVTYTSGLMNMNMALGVNPASGEVTVVGTDAINEVRFEPLLTGIFTRVHIGLLDAAGSALGVFDLNDHLDYSVPSLPVGQRSMAIGDPRGIAWNALGSRAFVSGMGSNNLVVLDSSAIRVTPGATIEVGEGPTGVVIDEALGMVYVLNKFESSISQVSMAGEVELARVPFHDASPAAIKLGRKHLYDTHRNSGLGQIACASCHVDARVDRLAWDLGDPSGDMKVFDGNCFDTGCEDWHPMKGPMLTQTMQDIIGKEPLHWRGDRTGLEEFAGAFVGLQGGDGPLGAQEMTEFEDFLATIHFPPNPFRNFDNSLPTNLDLPGHFTTGRFAGEGQPLGQGDAVRGLQLYSPPNVLDGGLLACATCHTLPTGLGTDTLFNGSIHAPLPPGPDGELHHALVSIDGATQHSFKIPQLRNLYERTGFNTTRGSNAAGFGFLHDGSVDSIERFISEPVFTVQSDQDVADVLAFMLAFSGSDLPMGSPSNLLLPPGTASLDTHTAVGAQRTYASGSSLTSEELQFLNDVLSLADSGAVALVVKGLVAGEARGYAYIGSGIFQSDRAGATMDGLTLLLGTAAGAELTLSVVPVGVEFRLGVDRDEDGFFDRDEIDAGSDPADPFSTPIGPGSMYCLGDGLGTPCPCGNDDPAGGGGCANSSGGGALLLASGFAQTSSDTLVLHATGLVPSQPALVFQGDNAIAGGAGVVFGDGLRCAGGDVRRIAVGFASSLGELNYPAAGQASISSVVGAVSGMIRRYQVWYRDPVIGPCAQHFNLSNGYEVTWQ
ncbi:MAG: hypothetical protein ABGY71_02535 [bacterium]|nr:hypothetical protein [Planctomycetota bacterium]HIL51614.1 hypothetical protein [Planctomycetota bacterium]